MKLLVTGAAGFTGRALIGAVLRAEPAALVVGLGPRRPSEALPAGVIWQTGSAAEPSKVTALIRAHRLDHVAHLARTTREGDPATLMRSQAGGALGLLHGVREAGGVERVLLLGSAAEYGLWEERDLPIPETREPHPVSAYGYSKLAETTVGLLAHRELGVPALVARVFNPVGPGQDPSFVCGSLVAQVVEMRRAGRAAPLRVGRTSPIRDFLDVEDVAVALSRLLLRGEPGQCYNVGSGRGTRVREVIAMLEEITGITPPLADPDSAVESPGAQHSLADMEKLWRATGFRCDRPLRETLGRMLT